jgi:Asp-tRNA(Asn)/Glu-tRNA(Gln) amidotransferase A subunit family amidase
LGIPTGPYLQKTSAEGLSHFQATIEKLSSAGFIVKEVVAMADFDEIIAWHNDLMAGEMALVHQDWFAHYQGLYHPRTAALIERGHQVSTATIKVYAAARERLRADLEALMVEHQFSLWIAPSAVGPAPAGLGSTGDPVMNLPWTNAGLPVINLSSGFTQTGLPLGLQVAGRWQADEELLSWARQIVAALAEE